MQLFQVNHTDYIMQLTRDFLQFTFAIEALFSQPSDFGHRSKNLRRKSGSYVMLIQHIFTVSFKCVCKQCAFSTFYAN